MFRCPWFSFIGEGGSMAGAAAEKLGARFCEAEDAGRGLADVSRNGEVEDEPCTKPEMALFTRSAM
jgi:hypothetical protein